MKNTVESAVVVPALQATITGVLAACAVLSGCVVWRWPWGYAGLAGVGVMFWAWLFFRSEVQRRLDVEAGVDTAQAQPVQLQAQPVQEYRLEIDYDSGKAGDWLSLGVPFEKFTQWACGVAEGRSLAESQWIGSRGIFSRGEYVHMLTELLNRGYIRRRSLNGHQLGYELCAKGKALVRGASTPFTHSHTLTRFPA